MAKKNNFDDFYIANYTNLRSNMLNEETPFAALEAYKSARTHLLYTCPGEGGCKKICFTSASAHEGKSLTCINLAISLAQTGKKVLIIDADLRRPMQKNVFEIKETQGLSELLAGISNSDSSEAIRIFASKTDVDNLFILPAGNIPPNPAELLSSSRLHDIIQVLEPHFNFIFIDTPPIGVVTDTALIIPEVNGHIFVIRAGVAKQDEVHKAVESMKQLGANVLGFILNDCNPKKGTKRYGKSGYYSYNGYDYERKVGSKT